MRPGPGTCNRGGIRPGPAEPDTGITWPIWLLIPAGFLLVSLLAGGLT